MTELKKCPFCNGEASIAHEHSGIFIQCETCGAQSKYWNEDEQDAINAWNMRINNEWINVKDRLPGDHKDHNLGSYFLCYIKNKRKFHKIVSSRTYHLCWFDREKKVFTLCLSSKHIDDGTIECPVTHWMPFPEPPNE